MVKKAKRKSKPIGRVKKRRKFTLLKTDEKNETCEQTDNIPRILTPAIVLENDFERRKLPEKKHNHCDSLNKMETSNLPSMAKPASLVGNDIHENSVVHVSSQNDISEQGNSQSKKLKYKKYNNSDKGKKRLQTYLTNSKDKWNSIIKKYQTSKNGRLAFLSANRKYQKSENGRLAFLSANQKYQKTKKGRLAFLCAKQKYQKTKKGHVVKTNATKNYENTLKGRGARFCVFQRYHKTTQTQITLNYYLKNKKKT